MFSPFFCMDGKLGCLFLTPKRKKLYFLRLCSLSFFLFFSFFLGGKFCNRIFDNELFLGESFVKEESVTSNLRVSILQKKEKEKRNPSKWATAGPLINNAVANHVLLQIENKMIVLIRIIWIYWTRYYF